MSNEMFHLRHLSAVQWSGLKDSRPAPQGWLHKRLARWQREGNVWWSERHQRVAELLEATKQALVLLEPYQDTGGVTALWLRGGRLQCEYLELLREFLEDERDPPHFWSKLSDFTARLAAFYAEEQAPLSARHNAELVTAPLIDATHTERAGA